MSEIIFSMIFCIGKYKRSARRDKTKYPLYLSIERALLYSNDTLDGVCYLASSLIVVFSAFVIFWVVSLPSFVSFDVSFVVSFAVVSVFLCYTGFAKMLCWFSPGILCFVRCPCDTLSHARHRTICRCHYIGLIGRLVCRTLFAAYCPSAI